MVKITEIIYEYMQSNRRLTLPGLGALIVKGGGEIIFSEFVKVDDGALRGEMVRRGVAEVSAAAQIEEFVEDVRGRLEDEGGSFFVAGLGLLVRRDDAICFEACTEPVEIEQPKPTPEPTPTPDSESPSKTQQDSEPEPEEEKTPTPKKKRKMDPLVIFIVVSALIALFFFARGFIIGWSIGTISLPGPADRVMVKIFGDGFDEVEEVEMVDLSEVEE